MARTPVTTEVIEETQALVSDKPRRTPVLVEDGETLIEKGATLKELAVAAENGAMDAKPRHEVKPIIDGYRECARPDCTASFKPRSINPKDTEATEYYCSDDCAIHEFYRKRHLGPVPEKIVSGASQASNRAHKEERKRKRIEAAPEHDAKYGPMRKVIEILGETKTAKKVKLECGHVTSSRGEQQRCRQCRPGKEKTNGSPAGKQKGKGRRGADAAREESSAAQPSDTHSTRTRRQPVPKLREQPKASRELPRASSAKKRTPVKPPKRGKKGKPWMP